MAPCECPGSNVPNLATYLCPSPDSELRHFKEVIICDTLEIPAEKPPKEHITNVTKDVMITDVQIIDVTLGDKVPRKKIAISGVIKLGIEYSALEDEQQVHFFHACIPFQALIGERPCTSTNRGLLPDSFNPDDWILHVCVEHEQYHQLSPRLIKAVLVILVWYAPKPKP